MYISLLEATIDHKSSYLKLEHGGGKKFLPAFWKFPEVNVFHRIFPAVSSRKKTAPASQESEHDDGVERGGREEPRARGGKAVDLHREVSACA